MKKKDHRHKVSTVEPGSIAEELGIEPGDFLLAVNDQEIEDIFDYHYLINEEYLTVLIEKPDGEQWELEIEKEFEDDLGMEFENGLMDDYRSCHNKCIFCFIDQMPPGMRETLYFKDDDSRLSFLQGNYVTLTNMSEHDIDRIIRYHLGPINVSFQAMNPKLRCQMLHNRFAGEALKKVDRLYENGIEMNGQIVLCKGVNDGEELRYSIEALGKYMPVLQSVSVVPVGLTKFREGLYPLEPFNKEDAGEVLDMIEHYQKIFYEKYGIHGIHAGDEWYLLAERELPEAERYDGYIQYENGVGMLRSLIDEVEEELALRGKGREHFSYNFHCHRLFGGSGLKAAGRPGAGKIPQCLHRSLSDRQPFFRGADHCGRSSDFPGPEGTASGEKSGRAAASSEHDCEERRGSFPGRLPGRRSGNCFTNAGEYCKIKRSGFCGSPFNGRRRGPSFPDR